MGFVKILIGLPIIIVILIFSFVNNDLSTFSLWPFDLEITVSWSVAILFFVVIGFWLGHLFSWMSYAPLRKDLRQQKKANKKLSKQQQILSETVSDLQGNLEQIKAEKQAAEQPKKQGFFSRFKKKEAEPVVNISEDGIF